METDQIEENETTELPTTGDEEPAISEEINPDQPSPEYLQRKLYFLVEHLKTMHSKLPE